MKINETEQEERHTVEMPKDKETVALCRCWKSKKFPLCDGAHKEHNQKNGDKVGPVIVKK